MNDISSKNWNIIKLEETESTNLYLRQLLLDTEIEEFTTIVTDFQSGGRGQRGNSWTSDRGQNLLFSFVVYPKNIFANEQFILSRVVSLALVYVLSDFTNDIKIKWPNDIYWKDHKIAGILIENNLLGKVIDSSIVGIGLNINQTSFPEFLVNPTSLSKITGEVHDVQYLLNRFMQEFESLYANIENDRQAIEERYMHNLYRLQGYHLYKDKDGEFEAKIIDVAPSGHLYLQAIYEDCQRVYAFKEVQFLNR